MLTRDFIEKFDALNNKVADVKIEHLLYGNQKLNRCVLRPFVDEGRIGLIIEDEEKYITMDELCEVGIDDKCCYLKSELMELYINYTV
jgi:hypothetical protein